MAVKKSLRNRAIIIIIIFIIIIVTSTEHLESNKLRFKEHLAFNEQSLVFFCPSLTLKIPCIKRTNLTPVLGFNKLLVLANPR